MGAPRVPPLVSTVGLPAGDCGHLALTLKLAVRTLSTVVLSRRFCPSRLAFVFCSPCCQQSVQRSGAARGSALAHSSSLALALAPVATSGRELLGTGTCIQLRSTFINSMELGRLAALEPQFVLE